ncbi:hypothetical protein [Streptococcus hyointestinalis]|uniref:hypothetical protein n=1 Tax=Streptococcus hyointestinalis TaxID=1337 RepID=UPI0013DEEB7E|nr:hypothetical protein [Streptococcus hyointestinalis]
MRKDAKMETHVTKNGYTYYTPTKPTQAVPPEAKESKWKKGVKWLRQALLAGVRNLPGLIMKAAILMVTTPLMIVLFIFNFLKCLLGTTIAWVVFKFVVMLGIALTFDIYESLAKRAVADNFGNWLDNLFSSFVWPHGVPIYYWWETTIIVVLAVITALSLTFHPNEE